MLLALRVGPLMEAQEAQGHRQAFLALLSLAVVVVAAVSQTLLGQEVAAREGRAVVGLVLPRPQMGPPERQIVAVAVVVLARLRSLDQLTEQAATAARVL